MRLLKKDQNGHTFTAPYKNEKFNINIGHEWGAYKQIYLICNSCVDL